MNRSSFDQELALRSKEKEKEEIVPNLDFDETIKLNLNDSIVEIQIQHTLDLVKMYFFLNEKCLSLVSDRAENE